ncbi:NodT family efflux transporter outer membrane factor (OMF) lipoprotein [Pseudoduganella flava]|uniref:Efflux transporter outer membrane subunit n=1 Tax=Pseudoduganella flava TaxID=871742 RepID=A0A562PRS3_9BURK|nr:efflux transporter outer membrane subunit [Pseudoduganella flava]QGZ37937.1 efflux transporter outer membrane subunit [Pseudoduganella flava]TWI46776.1 NodT family efflux transporter outer membrane factor (OMF) lipoprotein [Pseudoduganella flava]
MAEFTDTTRKLAALLLAGALSACAGPAQRVAMPVPPERWPADAADDGAAATPLDWRDYFDHPALQALIARGLACNGDVRTAAARVREAAALAGLQHANRFPAIGAGIDVQRNRIPHDLSPTGHDLLSTQYQAGVQVSWEADLWGRLAALDDAALQAWLGSEASRRAVALALIGQVAERYLALRELDERIVLAERTLASRNASLRIFRRRVEEGATARLDLAQVQTLQTQAEALVSQLRQQRALQAHALDVLTGGAGEPPPEQGRFDDLLVLRPLAAGLPSDVLLARPDVAAAERQLRAARYQVDAARAAFFPRISLTGSYGSASAQLAGLFDNGSHAWTFAPTLAQPLFDFGRNRANLGAAEARTEAAVATYDKTIRTAFREVADALASRHHLADQVRIGETALAAQRERDRLARLRYDNGATTYLEVLDAQRDLLTAEQQQVQVRRALLSAQVSLYLALGGGSGAVDTAACTQQGRDHG